MTIILLLVCMPIVLFSETFISLEELMTKQNRWKVNASITVSNSEITQLSYTTDYVEIYPGLFSPVTVPYNQIIETTAISSGIGIKYGLSSWTEVSMRASNQAIWGRDRVQTEGVLDKEFIFEELVIGIHQKLLKEKWWPAVFMFIEMVPIQSIEFPEYGFQEVSWGQFSGGAMFYKTMDPVVLGLTIAYQFNRGKTWGRASMNNGEVTIINPSIYFTVNDEITLNWGASYRQVSRSYQNGDVSQLSTRTCQFDMGIGYMINYDWTINTAATFEQQSFGLSVQSSYQF